MQTRNETSDVGLQLVIAPDLVVDDLAARLVSRLQEFLPRALLLEYCLPRVCCACASQRGPGS